MLDIGAMTGLVMVIITCIWFANAQSTTATEPFQYIACYTDRCNVDKMMSCSHSEKRCVNCQPYVHDCTINPDRLERIPTECIIYCRQRIHDEKRRLQNELKLNETIQAYENKIQEQIKQNVQTGGEKEGSPQQDQPSCQPTWIVFWISVAFGALGWLYGLKRLFGYCIIWIRRKKRGASSRTWGSQTHETCIEMTSSADAEQKAGSQAGAYASSGYGSKDLTFPKSRESQLAAPRVEREIPRRANPDLETLSALPPDFLEQVERTCHKAEEDQRQRRMQQQQAQRQQGRDYSEQAEEGQRLLESQVDDHENKQQQQQQQQQQGRQLQWESPTRPHYPESSLDNRDFQRDETRDVRQPRRGRNPHGYETLGESCNNGNMAAVSRIGGHSQPENGTVPSPASAPVCQGCPEGKQALRKLTQVPPTSNG